MLGKHMAWLVGANANALECTYTAQCVLGYCAASHVLTGEAASRVAISQVRL
jgi:hypothetical protein